MIDKPFVTYTSIPWGVNLPVHSPWSEQEEQMVDLHAFELDNTD